jgi:hypothetical protein
MKKALETIKIAFEIGFAGSDLPKVRHCCEFAKRNGSISVKNGRDRHFRKSSRKSSNDFSTK